jgi:acetoacetyl-CoA synthetase
MGTSDFYNAVEELPEVVDSLVVDTGQLGREEKLLLFVVLRRDAVLDAELKARVNEKLRRDLSPRHVPDEIHTIPEVPYTLNGKKVEVPIKRLLAGTPVEEAISRDAMRNPESLQYFISMAKEFASVDSTADAGTP